MIVGITVSGSSVIKIKDKMSIKIEAN